jgi:hypothetical protein
MEKGAMKMQESQNLSEFQNAGDGLRPADHVLKQVSDELRQLLAQRSEVIRKIGVARKTIAGLAILVGDSAVARDLYESMMGRSSARQPGITKACRVILMRAEHPLTVNQMLEQLRKGYPALLERHKDPKASVTTILNRLAEYGEVQRMVSGNYVRTWQWATDPVEPGAAPVEAAD